jgi:hypothetical protein
MDASEVVTRRFLAGFEGRAWSGLPGEWQAPKPEKGKRRRSAAVLLRVADERSLADMEHLLGEIAGRVQNREARASREAEATPGVRPAGSAKDPEESAEGAPGRPMAEAALWSEIARLVGGLRRGQPEVPESLFTLEICRGETWIRPLAEALREVGGTPPAATKEALAELARILLRAKARQWSDADRRAERGEEEEK